MSINLNDRLAHTSKKFAKACDQIKLLKERIAELISIFTYCDPSNVTNNNHVSSSSNNNFNLNENNNNDNNTNNNNHNNNNNVFVNSNNVNNSNDSNLNDYNVNLFKESIKRQIENLQSIKTAYFMYAHHKADEITKLQCEIYGEDAVRQAYDQAPPSYLIAVDSAHMNQENADDNHVESVQESDNYSNLNDSSVNSSNEDYDQEDHNNDNNDLNWAPWDFQQNVQFEAQSRSNRQNQLIEYDFLMA